ncbi:MAG: hypothetical protein ACIAXF_09800 [Phycisphaerales bacterium JB063]
MKPIVLWIVVAGLLAAMALAGGCTLDEIVEVDIPPNTRAHFRDTLDADVPPTLTLRDARILRAEGDRRMTRQVEAQLADHAASNEALDAEIADGAFLESLLASSINTGVETALPGLAAVPGGAILTTLLAGVGMWLAPRPGDAKRQAEQAKQAEDHGYDLGRQETLELLQHQKAD